MTECLHLLQEKVVDRLGLMTEKPDGTVSAPVLEWSIRCADEDCGQTLFVSAEAYGSMEGPKRSAKMRAEPVPDPKDAPWLRREDVIQGPSLWQEFTQALRALLTGVK